MSFPKKCIVIDIGSEQIKIANIVRSKKDVKFLDSIVINTPEDCVEDGVIIDANVLGETIRGALVEIKTKVKEVVFILASSKIITREVSFPDVNNKKLESVVEMNAGEYFPVNLNDYVVDYSLIERTENKGEKLVVVTIIAALKGLVDGYVALAKVCGLHLAGIDYAGIALGNFAKKEELEGAQIVVDFGSGSSMVTIVENGIVKFSRNLMYGSNAVIEAIANSFDVSYEEALVISKERPLLSVTNESNPFLKNDVTDAMTEVLNGISRLVDYYTSRNDIKFDHIIMVGGGATIYGIREYVENYFSIATEVLDEYKSVNTASHRRFFHHQVYFANIIGACYSDINLIPQKVSKRTQSRSKLRVEFLFVVLVVVIMGALSYLKINNINNLKEEKADLELKIEESKKIIEIKDKWVELGGIVEFRSGLYDETMGITEKFNAIFTELENDMPNKVIVNSLKDNDDSIIMNCIAKDKMNAAKFIEVMKELESKQFDSVFVSSLNKVAIDEIEDDGIEELIVYDKSYYEFTITFKY